MKKQRIHVIMVWILSITILFIALLRECSSKDYWMISFIVVLAGGVQLFFFKEKLFGALSILFGFVMSLLVSLQFYELWYNNMCVLLSLYFVLIAAVRTRELIKGD